MCMKHATFSTETSHEMALCCVDIVIKSQQLLLQDSILHKSTLLNFKHFSVTSICNQYGRLSFTTFRSKTFQCVTHFNYIF